VSQADLVAFAATMGKVAKIQERAAATSRPARSAFPAFRAAIASRVWRVDRTSFEFMRQREIQRARAMDSDSATEGFEVEP
jgi:hypothetical protein